MNQGGFEQAPPDRVADRQRRPARFRAHRRSVAPRDAPGAALQAPAQLRPPERPIDRRGRAGAGRCDRSTQELGHTTLRRSAPISDAAGLLSSDRPLAGRAFPEECQSAAGYSDELLEEVGCGGMGVVYRARDIALGRDVVVKLLSPRYPPDRARFARAIATSRTSVAWVFIVLSVSVRHSDSATANDPATDRDCCFLQGPRTQPLPPTPFWLGSFTSSPPSAPGPGSSFRPRGAAGR
jgi:hypothetical protein